MANAAATREHLLEAVASLSDMATANNNQPTRSPTGRGEPPSQGRHGPQTLADASKRIQQSYRTNRPRAMREVLGQSSPPCDLPGSAVYDHLRRMFQKNTDERVRPFEWPAWCVPGEEERADALQSPLTQEEVLARLRRTHSSAPGPDGVTYGNIKKIDPKASMLTAVFNACLRTGHVPDQWKRSRTILIHKKGDRTDLSNWRPLSMGDSIPKLFAAVMADRLTAFLTNGGRLSNSQKGFLQHEGCHEHNFVLGQVLEDSRRQGKDLVMGWLDLSNAFGSIPHATIMDAVAGMGIPPRIHNILLQMATGATTTAKTMDGMSEEIPIEAGVRQGCPASPILFNMAIERIIRNIKNTNAGYTLYGNRISTLAYADDLVLIASSPEEMRSLLRAADAAAIEAGLHFNPKKCATLHLAGKKTYRRTVQTGFLVRGTQIPAMTEGDAYEYLGIPVGLGVDQTPRAKIEAMIEDISRIDGSLLAPWQKIDAVRTFVAPRLDFVLRSGATLQVRYWLNAEDTKTDQYSPTRTPGLS